MAGIFPLRTEVEIEPNGPSTIEIAGDDATTVFQTLASNTARRIFVRLHETPGTASDLAEHVDTSLQNVGYHLGSLQEAGLIRIVDTWYSSRGVEMKVYAPVHESLVLVAGDSGDIDIVKRAVKTSR